MMSLLILASFLSCFCIIQGLCPDQWTQYHGSCYYLFEDLEEWAQANYICGTHNNGHLATIESAGENSFLKSLAKNHQVHRSDVWIGANDMMSEGDYRWVGTDNKVTFHDWSHGQPDNKGHENCVSLGKNYDFKWNDLTCSFKSHYICETSPTDIVG